VKKRVLTPEEMRRSDKATLAKKGIGEFDLMEDAARAIHGVMEEEGILEGIRRVVVVSGPGNNGGDGFGLARHLLDDGIEVALVLVGGEEALREPARTMLAKVKREATSFDVVRGHDDVALLEEKLAACDLVVDALFGIGVEGAIKGVAGEVVNVMNEKSPLIVAIDIPSGLNAYNGLAEGSVIRADHTIVVQALKTGNLLADALDHHGVIHVADAGILMAPSITDRYLIEDGTFAGVLPPRKKNTHKYDYGNILVIGGNRGMEGASILTAEAALRSGAGLVRTLSPVTAETGRILSPPEVMHAVYEDGEDIVSHLKKTTAVAFGMGLGRKSPADREILANVLEKRIPTVIDADGLHVLKRLFETSPSLDNAVLTPHAGELAALHETSVGAVMSDPFHHMTGLASRFGATIVLKGPVTLIVHEDIQYLSAIGTPGMATAGSGDVLSGVIARFQGEGHDPVTAAAYGVYAQALAGSLAEAAFGEEGMVATDIVAFLPEALARMKG